MQSITELKIKPHHREMPSMFPPVKVLGKFSCVRSCRCGTATFLNRKQCNPLWLLLVIFFVFFLSVLVLSFKALYVCMRECKRKRAASLNHSCVSLSVW